SASTILNLNSAATFNSGFDESGSLTAGTLNVKGNFSASTNTCLNSTDAGTHQTVLNGTAQQSLSFGFPSPTQSHFQNLRLANPTGALLTTGVQVNGNFDVTVAAPVAGTGSLTVVGTITTLAGSAVTASSVTLSGPIAA